MTQLVDSLTCWKLPCGTTTLELVVSGRSVAISLPGCGQVSAAAAAIDAGGEGQEAEKS